MPARTLGDISDSDAEVELELNDEMSFNHFCTKLKHQLQHRTPRARRRLRRLKASAFELIEKDPFEKMAFKVALDELK